jgi:hypothetical protein
MTYTIIPATTDHGILLNVSLCEADREELAASQAQPLGAVMHGIFDSVAPVTILDKHGSIAAIAGVVHVSDALGAPWMLSTDATKTEPLAFVRQAREWVDQQLTTYERLAHQVYRHNHNHIRLLKLLGFEVEEPRHSSQLFLPFSQCAYLPPSSV